VSTEERDQLRKAMVPMVVQNALEKPKETEARQRVAAWFPGDRSTLVLLGSLGCGKTIGGCSAILNNFRLRPVFLHEPGDLPLQKLWRGSTFVSLAELASASLWDAEDRALRERCDGTSLLILDDAGAERGDGAATITQLLTSRMSGRRRTIVTSNLLPGAFAIRYGERIMDRIRGDGEIYSLTGPSLRGLDMSDSLLAPGGLALSRLRAG
jgi:DNA replication protein DnaC